MISLLVVSTLLWVDSSDAVLLDIVRDAQVASAAKLKRGSLSATVEQETNYTAAQLAAQAGRVGKKPSRVAKNLLPTSGTATAEVTAHWDGDDLFLVAELNDPHKIMEKSIRRDSDNKSTYLCLYKKDKFYSYSPLSNTITVVATDRLKSLATKWLFEVTPSSNWARCCPPSTILGRDWTEFLTLNAPFYEKETRVTARQVDQDTVRYIRVNPDGGESRIDFSLTYGGNATEYSYTAANAKLPKISGTMTWRKDKEGVVVLQNRQHIIRDEDDLDFIKTQYRMTVKSCNITRGSSPLISFASLKGQVPKNALVDDRTTNKKYPLFPQTKPNPEIDFDQLSEELKSGGLLKGKK